MHNRIKEVRKNAGLTQQEFADRLGISRSNIGNYESGSRAPIDAAIKLICAKFNVNEVWLRTGEGEPYVQLSRQAEIARIIGRFMDASPEREALICALGDDTDEQIRAVHDLTMKYAAEYGIRKKSPDP